MNAMIVNAKQAAMMRPTKTISPAWCCSGVLFTGLLREALVRCIAFSNCATTTAPHHYGNQYRVTQ